jgi:hypothetical protein
MRRLAYGVLGLAIALGCSSTPLQPVDSGVGQDALVPGDAGVGPDALPPGDGGSADRDATLAEGPPPLKGTRSFVVTSTLTPQADAGSGMVPLGSGHRFTLILDYDSGSAIVGADGTGGHATAAISGTSVLVAQSLSFSLGNGTSVSYERVELTIDSAAGTLAGTGRGRAFYVPPTSDVGSTIGVVASLAGGPDTEPPTFRASVSGTGVDPFSSLTVTASEPLPPSTTLIVVDGRGGRVDLAPSTVAADAAFSFFPSPFRMWRYGESYTIVTDVRDFAGNPSAASALTFMTAPPPPLAPEDGFEGATGATFAGAEVLSGAGAPTLAGARSLYIPPLPQVFPPGRGDMTQLAVRVAIDAADTTLRFSYRTVNPNAASNGTADPYFLLGAEGGEVRNAVLGPDAAAATPATIPGQGDVTLGPLMTAAIALPPGAGAAGAITLVRKVRACCGGLPGPSVPGLILDDLRTE